MKFSSLPLRNKNSLEITEGLYPINGKIPFQIYSPTDRLPSFFFIAKDGIVNPNFFSIKIHNAETGSVECFGSDLVFTRAFKIGSKIYVTYDGDVIDSMNMSCGPKFIEINGMVSPIFYVTDDCLSKFTVGNTYQIGDVPYQTGFKQIFYVKENISSPVQVTYKEVTKSERYADFTNYASIKNKYIYRAYSAPLFFSELLNSITLCNYINVQGRFANFQISDSDSELVQEKIYGNFFDLTLSLFEIVSEIDSCELDNNWIEITNPSGDNPCLNECGLNVVRVIIRGKSCKLNVVKVSSPSIKILEPFYPEVE